MKLDIGVSVDSLAGLGRPSGSAPAWVSRDVNGVAASWALDVANDRGYLNGATYSSEAAFLVAANGSKVGNVRTITPQVKPGAVELLANGTFDANITGWAYGSTYTASGTLSWDSTNGGRLKNTTVGAGQSRISQGPLSFSVGKAVVATGTMTSTTVSGSGTVTVGNNSDLNGGNSSLNTAGPPNTPRSVYHVSETGTIYVGCNTNPAAATVDTWDNFSAKEVVPFVGHDYTKISGRIRGTTPSAASGNKVIFEADDTGAALRNYVRLVWDSTKHLRLITRQNNVEQSNLDLGIVEVSTAFDVRFSCTVNSVMASLNGGAAQSDTSATHPGIAGLIIGNSRGSEAWDGGVTSVELWANTQSGFYIDPQLAFAIYGDSTAHGDGANTIPGGQWFYTLANSYSPPRTYYQAGVSGQGIQAMADGVIADAAHVLWSTVFYDRKNTGETADLWMTQIDRAVQHLQTSRYLIMPQVPYADGAEDPTNQAILDDINARIIATYPNNTFDATTQANFLTALAPGSTRSDGLHRNDSGQAIEKTYMRNFFDAKGW